MKAHLSIVLVEGIAMVVLSQERLTVVLEHLPSGSGSHESSLAGICTWHLGAECCWLNREGIGKAQAVGNKNSTL